MRSIEKIREYLTQCIIEGFDTLDEIYDGATMIFDSDAEDDPDFEEVVRQILQEQLAEHYARQLTWQTPTDCDKLDLAFDDLNQQGIIARQNFACCQNCGRAEIWEDIDEARDGGQTVIGFTFYDLQVTENAAKGNGLSLVYDTITLELDAVGIGKHIVAALARAGLPVVWSGSDRERIHITPFDWKRRRAPPNA